MYIALGEISKHAGIATTGHADMCVHVSGYVHMHSVPEDYLHGGG